MKGDFTKLTFRPEKHYTSVRMQQGRLQLDSDWNEQVDIQNHLRHTQIVDLIGADSGVPTSVGDSENPYKDSFKITVIENGSDLAIAPGHLYTNGTLCELETKTSFTAKIKAPNRVEVSSLIADGYQLAENQWVEIVAEGNHQSPTYIQIISVDSQARELTLSDNFYQTDEDLGKEIQLRRVLTYKTQPDYPNPTDDQKLTDGIYVAYLDVWQRHITTIEDPNIREVALNIPDTTTRTKTIWQLKLKKIEQLIEKVGDSPEQNNILETLENNKTLNNLDDSISKSQIDQMWRQFVEQQKNRQQQAKLNACAKYCLSSSNSASTGISYQRLENQLYRVEIHDSGTVGGTEKNQIATFKWSRDNGSTFSAIEKFQPENNTIIIRKSSQDAWSSYKTGQWIEITDDEMELKGKPGILAPLLKVSDTKIEFDNSRIVNAPVPFYPTKVRRWDHTTQEAAIVTQSEWTPLEAGIKVKFEPNSSYETGDYWLIPARSATNDIEWANDQAKPTPQPLPQFPQGIYHDYCLLGLVKFNGEKFDQEKDLRVVFPPLMRCADKSEVDHQFTVVNSTLETKADQSEVENQFTVVNSTLETKANKSEVDHQFTVVNSTLETKANKSEVDHQFTVVNSTLETKANKSEVENQFTVFNSALETKADKSEVENQFTVVNSTLETKADKLEVDHQFTVVNSTLETKADKLEVENQFTVVNSTLETKADKSEVENQFTVVNSTLETKTNKSEVDHQFTVVNSTLETKADKSEVENQFTVVNSTLETKTNKSEVDHQFTVVNSTLETKADKSEVENQFTVVNSTLETKADKSEVENQFTVVNSTLETKADKSEVENQFTVVNSTLETKADKLEVENQFTVVNSTLETKANQNGDVQQDFNAKVITTEELKTKKLTQNSSITLKDEVTNLSSQEAAEMLKALTPVKFIFTEDDSKTPHVGFIAEDTPELLTANDKQVIKVVDIVAVINKVVQDNQKILNSLVKIVKNQQAEITALKKTVQDLETQRLEMEKQ